MSELMEKPSGIAMRFGNLAESFGPWNSSIINSGCRSSCEPDCRSSYKSIEEAIS